MRYYIKEERPLLLYLYVVTEKIR